MSQFASRILSRIPFGPIVCITFALILGFSAPVSADPPGYLYFKPSKSGSYDCQQQYVYRINPDTGSVSTIVAGSNCFNTGRVGLASIGNAETLICAWDIYETTYSSSRYAFLDVISPTSRIPFPFNPSPGYGLAFDPLTQTIYSIQNSSFRAITFDGVTTSLASFPGGQGHGLAWGQGGVFAVSNNSNNLYFYDPLADSWEIRGSINNGIIGSTGGPGLAYRPDIDKLYAIKANSNFPLLMIDPNTGESSLVVNLGQGQFGNNGSYYGGGLAWVSADCNENGIADHLDVLAGAEDCNGNSIPDECEPDCDGDGVLDECVITSGLSADCDNNGIPDECDPDCDENGLVDQCEINGGLAQDCDGNGIINPCEPDCDGNGFADACELLGGLASDCDNNGVIDSCDPDCDGNGLADACELIAGTGADCNADGVLDACEVDCDDNGIADVCEGRSFRNRSPQLSIPCCDTYLDELIINEAGLIEDVDVRAQVNGAWQNTTQISVTSPSATTITNLHNQSGSGSSASQWEAVWSDTLDTGTRVPDGFTNSMTVWIGEPAAGTWSMSLTRANSNGGSGTWQEWGISLSTDSMAPDCDRDGIPDACESDCNFNGIPDDCDLGQGIHNPYQSALPSPLVIDNSAPITDTLTLIDDFVVSDFDFFIHYQHDSDCELQIQLTSPSGTVATVKDFGGDCGAVQKRARYSTGGESGYLIPFENLEESFAGESLLGTWTLSLNQTAVTPVGALYSWAILSRLNALEFDCDENGIPDSCDIATGAEEDCDGNGIPDSCELSSITDCNFDGVLDTCEIFQESSLDCDVSGILDSCEFEQGVLFDCNLNGTPDICDIQSGLSADCNNNLIPDNCEMQSGELVEFPFVSSSVSETVSCSQPNKSDQIFISRNAVIADLDVSVQTSISWQGGLGVSLQSPNGTGCTLHSYQNGTSDYGNRYYSDEYVPGYTAPYSSLSVFDGENIQGFWTLSMNNKTCNSSGTWFSWGIQQNFAEGVQYINLDCNSNGILDECDILSGIEVDCNGNGFADSCDLLLGLGNDCNGNGIIDSCEVASGSLLDCNQNEIPDSCELAAGLEDCNINGIPDICDLSVNFSSTDCDEDGVPDECQVFAGNALDCDGNGVLDQCELDLGFSRQFQSNESLPISFFNPANSMINIADDLIIDSLSVSLSISHPETESLRISLVGPGGEALLFTGGTSSGANFTDTTFSMSAIVDVNSSAPPYSGTFQPVESFDLWEGLNAKGDWALIVEDQSILIDGDLLSWSLDFVPRVLNDCNGNGVLDRCESDCDGNGIPDECEVLPVSGQIFNAFERQTISTSTKSFYVDIDPEISLIPTRVFLLGFYSTNFGAYSADDFKLISPSGQNYLLDLSSGHATSENTEWIEFGCSSVPVPPATTCSGSFNNNGGLSPSGLWRLTMRFTSGYTAYIDGFGFGFDTEPNSDCNDNDIPDACDIAEGVAFDCNDNGILDSCEAAQGAVFDCNGNGIADLCEYGPETDCNGNGILDDCDVLNGIEGDCDGDGVLDSCEVAAGASDCDANEIPDECQPDCDANGTADPCDIAAGAADCDADGVLDVCETDCNANGVPDDCDLASGTSEDCDGDGQPDECQLITGFVDCDNNGLIDVCQLFVEPDLDCDANGTIDFCELLNGTGADCDNNGVLDPCDIAQGYGDCDNDGLPDICEPDDCDGDGVPDACALASGLVEDCDGDELPDSCGIVSGIADDCDGNGIPDICTLISGIDTDCDLDNVLDACQIIAGASDCDQDGYLDSCALAEGSLPDCDGNGVIDSCDLAAGTSADADGDGIPDLCQSNGFVRGECNGDGSISIADAVFLLDHLFVGGPAGPCVKACDGNDDGGVDLSDVIYSLTYLFNGGAPPPHPWPDCGPDPTSDSLPCATAPVCP